MKKAVALFLTLALMLGIGASCAENITLNVLSYFVKPEKTIAAFQQEYPDIAINWEYIEDSVFSQALRTRIAAGGENLDIITPRRPDFPELAKGNVFQDVSHANFFDRLSEAAVKSVTIDGKQYGVPIENNAYIIWYNKDIFAQYGLVPPANWQELIAVCDKLVENDVAPFVIGAKNETYMNVLANAVYSRMESLDPAWGTKCKTGENKWTDEGSIDALKKFKLIADKYTLEGALGSDDTQAYQAFYQGKAAMFCNGSWSIRLFKDSMPSFSVGAFVPCFNEAGEPLRCAVSPGKSTCISAKSDKQDTCLKFIEFLTRVETSEIFTGEVMTFSCVNGASPNFHVLAAEIVPAFAMPSSEMIHTTFTIDLTLTMGKTLQMIMDGTITPEEAAQQLQDAQDMSF